MVALHERVCARLAEAWYDATDVLTDATQRFAIGEVHYQLGSCVLHLPQLLSRAEMQFAGALATDDFVVVTGLTGTQRADDAVRESVRALGGSVSDTVPIPTADHVLTASDSDDEVRCVVRDVVQTLQSTPAHKVAVLYAARLPYARLLHEQLAAAGIRVNGPGVRPADERAVARTLLELLALADGDVPRAELFQALANGPVRDFAGVRIPLARWERLSRAAGVVRGEDWSTRLDAYAEDRLAMAQQEAAGDDPRTGIVHRAEDEATAAGALRDFALRLRAELQQATAMTGWSELAGWCRELFSTLIGSDAAMRTLPAEEQYAAATIVSLLQGLDVLDEMDGAADLAGLRDLLALELAGAMHNVGRFGDGVLVAPVSASVGLDLDVVYCVGLAEDLYPGRVRPDALLPERARAASGGELRPVRERIDGRYRSLLIALASGGRAVASFPRGDLRRSARRLPSRWLLSSLRELSGDHSLAASAWESGGYGGRLASAGSYAGELTCTERLATEQEWRTRQAAAAGRLDDPAVIAAVDLISARAPAALTRYDGNLSRVDGLPDYAHESRAISPTALEKYAGCPHAFFVERLLGVRPVEQPEDIVVISPMEIGNLIHGSVEALVLACGADLPDYGQPWSPAQRQLFQRILDERCDEFARRGLTGHERLWKVERARILVDSMAMLDADDQWRAEVGARVLASELAFGMRGRPPVEVPLSDGWVLMRGSADKVDEGKDGTLYVTDIKTGKNDSYTGITQDDPVVDGTRLQLPVYAYAARAAYGETSTPVRSAYWFVRRTPGRVPLDGLALTPEVAGRYAETVGGLVSSISRGLFPLRAPAEPDFVYVKCAYCNPDGIGHGGNRERWERKRHDPVLHGLLTLLEPDVAAVQAEGQGRR